jgi:galactose-1-phosphate uridylyltransferase
MFTQIINGARKEQRVLVETDHAIAFVPYAINRAYETWVVSKTSPDMANEKHMHEIADAIRQVLLALYHLKSDPDYNSIVRQAAMDSANPNEWYRWHVVITPHSKFSKWAGIKGYGDFVPIMGTPEEHAQELKSCLTIPAPLASSDIARSKKGSVPRTTVKNQRKRLIQSGLVWVVVACGLSWYVNNR